MKNLTVAANLVLLLLAGCSKSQSIPGDHGAIAALQNKTFFEEVGNVKPYNPNNSYASKMSECIYADTDEKSCIVSTLPLIGMSKEQITVEDILDRTMISHDFLGETFREVLLRMNPETLQMFGSVTAIVISDKINPSFFYSASGAIYLSGRYFWRDVDEYEILSQVKDFREGSDLPLQFMFDHDYIKNGKSIKSRAQQNFQSYDEMAINTSRLLFHELTHANDYFPRTLYDGQDMSLGKTYQEIAHNRYVNLQLASDLQSTQVKSEKLKHIGQILFQEAKATSADSLMLAEEVIQEFKNDLATDAYAYSTKREDFAMCAEEALMLYYYNIPRYVAVIKLPMAYFVAPANYEYPIAWGEKSRVLQRRSKVARSLLLKTALVKQSARK